MITKWNLVGNSELYDWHLRRRFLYRFLKLLIESRFKFVRTVRGSICKGKFASFINWNTRNSVNGTWSTIWDVPSWCWTRLAARAWVSCGLIFEILKCWVMQHNNTKARFLVYMDNFLYNLYVATFLNRYSDESVVLLCSKKKLCVCLIVKILPTESHHA